MSPKSPQAPAMSPSDLPVEVALQRASGPRRTEADELLALFCDVTGDGPTVWAGRIIGFGEYEYRYDSGTTGRAPQIAFASGPREHTLYLANDAPERWPDVLGRLGKYRAGKSCIYLTRLDGVDRGALRELLELSLVQARTPPSS